MRIIISPAKKMNVDTDSMEHTQFPGFIAEAELLKQALRSMKPKELQKLWKCNDSITDLNVKRLSDMDLQKNLTPALLSFEGLQYQYMAPKVFEFSEFDYVSEHLRILSGFYGLLRPLDGIVPYRLEMQAKLAVNGHKDLYGYWGNKLSLQLASETNFILNLASKEYSKSVKPHLPAGFAFVDCVFAQSDRGKLVQKGTLCKMARGEMVRFLAENMIGSLEGVRSFSALGYACSAKHSVKNKLVFIQSKTKGIEPMF